MKNEREPRRGKSPGDPSETTDDFDDCVEWDESEDGYAVTLIGAPPSETLRGMPKTKPKPKKKPEPKK